MIAQTVLAFLLLAQAGAPPTPDHFVTDTATALSAPARLSIEDELRTYEKKTGNQVIVWIGQTTGDTPLEVWTGDTAQRWKIGHAHKDNGVVLFLFMRDRKIRIEVGYGAEGALPDATAKRIIDRVIRPQMRGGNVDGAVADGVRAIVGSLTPEYALPSPAAGNHADTSGDSSDDTPGWAIALFIAFFFAIPVGIIALIALIVARRKHKTFGKAMHDVWFWGGSGLGGFSGGGFGSGGGGGFGGFSAGGGSFGGGGASGGW